ncbi:ABC transporter permease [Aestuariivirga sp.]|uniref:ABC transporter permease n=1 Tax=Aestuariivirga sp. TaxID=2650926 RepID=UPI0039E6A3BB
MDLLLTLPIIIMTAATPLLLAALGEMVTERSGVLNLGVEGMMVMGAVAGFGGAFATGNPWVGVIASILAGMAMSLLFGFLTLTLLANQVATGLALTLLGLGLSALIGESFVGQPGVKLPAIGGIDPLVPFSILMVGLVSWFLFRTKMGLVIRAVGNSHASAHALGYNVIAVRYLSVLFGGAMSGLAGGYLSLVYTPQWVENMTSGRGWIALALVVFASWLPLRILAGAYLFGTISILSFVLQAQGLGIPSQFLSSLPYLGTILALVVISGNKALTRRNTPASLGQPFVPDR